MSRMMWNSVCALREEDLPIQATSLQLPSVLELLHLVLQFLLGLGTFWVASIIIVYSVTATWHAADIHWQQMEILDEDVSRLSRPRRYLHSILVFVFKRLGRLFLPIVFLHGLMHDIMEIMPTLLGPAVSLAIWWMEMRHDCTKWTSFDSMYRPILVFLTTVLDDPRKAIQDTPTSFPGTCFSKLILWLLPFINVPSASPGFFLGFNLGFLCFKLCDMEYINKIRQYERARTRLDLEKELEGASKEEIDLRMRFQPEHQLDKALFIYSGSFLSTAVLYDLPGIVDLQTSIWLRRASLSCACGNMAACKSMCLPAGIAVLLTMLVYWIYGTWLYMGGRKPRFQGGIKGPRRMNMQLPIVAEEADRRRKFALAWIRIL